MRILLPATAVVLLLSACNQQQPTPGRNRAGTPQVRATVVTVQTVLQPANRTTRHTVVIADSKARSTDEAETWRLYDTAARTVTFVDDLEQTYRRESIESVIARRRAALRRPVDRELPSAEFQATGAQRQILNVPAAQSLIRLGGYQRELWFARHPLIPDELFAMIHGSAEPATRLGAIVAQADEALIAARGFPLLDRAEMPYGKNKMIVERSVIRIEQKDVPASLLQIPRGYRDVTAPDESRPPASSPPRGQTAPAAGSPPSSTTRTAP